MAAFDPEQHDAWVSQRFLDNALRVAKYALFDELIDYALDGDCTVTQAIDQYKHDALEMENGTAA